MIRWPACICALVVAAGLAGASDPARAGDGSEVIAAAPGAPAAPPPSGSEPSPLARWLSEAPDGSGGPPPAQGLHGEIAVGVGSGGERDAYGSVSGASGGVSGALEVGVAHGRGAFGPRWPALECEGPGAPPGSCP